MSLADAGAHRVGLVETRHHDGHFDDVGVRGCAYARVVESVRGGIHHVTRSCANGVLALPSLRRWELLATLACGRDCRWDREEEEEFSNSEKVYRSERSYARAVE